MVNLSDTRSKLGVLEIRYSRVSASCNSIDYEDLAPQVGLEPTTLRLTARNLLGSALSRVALCMHFLCFMRFEVSGKLWDYPQFCRSLKDYTHKSPHSLREAFIYLLSHHHPMGEVLAPARRDSV